MKKLGYWAICGWVVLLLAGCGGQGPGGINDTTRGEGDIPVGRVVPIGGRKLVTTLETSSGTLSGTVDGSGTLRYAALPEGEVILSVEAEDQSLTPVRLPLTLGPAASYVANVALVPKSSGAVVESLEIELPMGSTVAVGRRLTILVKARGTRVQNLQPTVWLETPIGALDEINGFTGVSVGETRVFAELLGVTTSATVRVTPTALAKNGL